VLLHLLPRRSRRLLSFSWHTPLAVGAFLFSALSSRVDAFSAWVQGCNTGRPDTPALVVQELNENLLLSAIGRSDLNSPRIIFQVRNIYIYN
jgi:hypothetical protein